MIRIGKGWYSLESLVIGKLALGFHGRFEGCLRREHWLAREPGTVEPLWFNRHENILPELKKAGLQIGDGNLEPNLHQPGRGEELLFLLLLPGDEVQGRAEIWIKLEEEPIGRNENY